MKSLLYALLAAITTTSCSVTPSVPANKFLIEGTVENVPDSTISTNSKNNWESLSKKTQLSMANFLSATPSAYYKKGFSCQTQKAFPDLGEAFG